MSKVNKIVITFPHALGIPGGGTENCIQLARHLRQLGVGVWLVPVMSGDFFSPDRAKLSDDVMARQSAVEAELETLGIRVCRVRPNPLHYLLDGLGVRKVVEEILREQTVDAVIGWHQETAFLSGPAGRHSFLQVMFMAGSYGFIHGRRRFILLRFVLRRSLRLARIVFANSDFTRRSVSAIFRVPAEKIAIAYCGIDPAYFSARPRPYTNGPVRLFYFGRITFQKGIFDLLEALGKLSAEGLRNWELAVGGWGAIERAREKAAGFGIGEQVRFLGKLERDIIIRQLETAQAAVLPSYSESFGLAVAESLAAGTPVIGYEAGAVPELVEHGANGWLVPTGDKAGLAEAIEQVLRSPGLAEQMGAAGPAKVRGRFTWEQAAGTILAHLDGLTISEE